jgi:hypothetical protein
LATQTFKKLPLSGSTDGNVISVMATATPGTTIHTATTFATDDSCDEVWIWASSTSASALNMGIQIGNLNNELDTINVRVPAAYNGPIAVLPGLPVRNGRVIQATVSTAGRVNVFGFVNRINGQV